MLILQNRPDDWFEAFYLFYTLFYGLLLSNNPVPVGLNKDEGSSALVTLSLVDPKRPPFEGSFNLAVWASDKFPKNEGV